MRYPAVVSEPRPALLPLFRSDNQVRLLTALLLQPRRSFTIGELAREAGVAQPTVSREVALLRRAGVVSDERDHGRRVVRANTGSPIFGELASMLLKTVGPKSVLERALVSVRGVDRAVIHGSWARRYTGEPGDDPGDVDVVVIGRPDVAEVRRAADEASSELGRDVDVAVLTPEEWRRARTGFLEQVKRSPLVELDLRGGAA